MRVALASAALLALAAAAGASAAFAPGLTRLVVVYRADGSKASMQVSWTLWCRPARGTHPDRVAACRTLARAGRRGLLPPPPGTACTAIYGGPQTAIVSGLVDGRRIWVRLRRDDGCQIDRWNGLRPLVP